MPPVRTAATACSWHAPDQTQGTERGFLCSGGFIFLYRKPDADGGFSSASYATAVLQYTDPQSHQPLTDINSASMLTANLRHAHKSTLPSSCCLLSSQGSTEETTLISSKLIQIGINKTTVKINFIKSFWFNISLDSPYCKLEVRLSTSYVNTNEVWLLQTSWSVGSLLRGEDQGSPQQHTCMNPGHICLSKTVSKKEWHSTLLTFLYRRENSISSG